jgi:UDP-2,4-diacetamido-2,4,6-trideoxy-beta-L-altropyranose hydrolase
LIEKIKSRGFVLSIIPETLSMEEDVKCFTMLSKKHNAEVVITDNYHFTDDYLKYLRQNLRVIVSIDDIAETFFCSDILINQNINATKEIYHGKISNGTKLFLGPRYAILGSEFCSYHSLEREFDTVKKVLVTLGGVDFENQTLSVLRALDKVEEDFSVTVVLGVSNPHMEELVSFAESSQRAIMVLVNVNNMAELMYNADMAISASGSTSWELCCVGLPIIMMALADNQRNIGERLSEAGISINLGWFNDVTDTMIQESVKSLISDQQLRVSMRERGKTLVDGNGAARIADEIEMLIA